MLHYIYSRSLVGIVFFMAMALVIWSILSVRIAEKHWRTGNLIFASLMAFSILYVTLLSRAEGSTGVILAPFASFTAARQQPEIYRSMLMNVFLFFPFGLSFANALPRKWHHCIRILLTTLTACLFSIGIEYTQYRFSLGLTETDDVICNTLGAFLGSASLLLAHAIEIRNERRLHRNMVLTTIETQFLQITKAAVSGGELPAENVDWQAIFTIAGQQKLMPILFEAVRKSPAADENAILFDTIKKQVIGQVLNQTVRSVEFTELYGKLRAAGLHPLVVKGILCSRLYPLKDHRISADDDMCIPDAEFMMCHGQLLENGLTTETAPDALMTADEVSYTQKGSPLYIELHRHLFDSSEDAHDELNHFFADGYPVYSGLSEPRQGSPRQRFSV